MAWWGMQLTILLSVMVSFTSTDIAGNLDLEEGAVYEGFAYEVFQIQASGETLSVSITSNFDTYLILCSPEKTFHKDDDSGEGSNASIAIPNPSTGAWTVIATSFSPSQNGNFSLAVEGGSHAVRVEPTAVDAELVEMAFDSRGVKNQVRERARNLQMLEKQLTLPSFREELISSIRSAAEAFAVDDHEREMRKRMQALEKRVQDIGVALDEATFLETSADLVLELLEKEMASKKTSLLYVSEELEMRARKREGFEYALGALIEFHEAALKLAQLKTQLLDPQIEPAKVHVIRDEVGQFQAVVDEQATEIAIRLLKQTSHAPQGQR